MAPDIRIEVDELDGDRAPDWAGRLLQSPLFGLLAPVSLKRVFDALERIPLMAGETLIAEGAPAGDYYIVAEGLASMSRENPAEGRRLSLGLLGPGEAFGEVPLITGQPWTARVRWKADGAVMRLPSAVFRSAICSAVLEGLAAGEATLAQVAGAVWLDVREPAAYRVAHLDGALNVPLALLPWLCARLAPAQPYLAYADDPTQAAAAAFQLRAAGHRARYLAVPWQTLGSAPAAATPADSPVEALIAARVEAREAALRQTFSRAWARREQALHAAYARLLAGGTAHTEQGATADSARVLVRRAALEGPTA